jgi:Fe-S cluster biosynthesis and repair protein YggX
MLNLKETDIAWIAGLLEGEGYFGIDNRSKDRYEVSNTPPAPFIKISMVDEDIIERLSQLLDKSYFSPTRKTVTGKQVYTLHLGEKEKVLFVLQKILPYMGARRGERIKESISHLQTWKEWVENGGRVENAKRANQIGQLKRSKSQDMTVLMG